MKKSIIISTIISLVLLSGSITTIAIKSADAATTTSEQASTITFADTPTVPTLNPNHETVYLITDHAGVVNQTYLGSLPSTSTESLPLALDIHYYLDGQPIAPAELIGKSGHVCVSYHYLATRIYQGKLVPFVVVTGLTLDSSKFTNLTLENARIISEGNQIILAGYSLVGLNENLGTTLLPAKFAFEADVTNFSLSDTYTIAVNDVIADLDTTKLTTVDSLINSISQLTGSFDQILTGANHLNQGAASLAAGLDQVVALHNDLLAKANTAIDKVTTIANQIIEEYDLDPALIEELTAPIKKYYDEAYTAITTYTDGIKKLDDGANQLSAGIGELERGLKTFKSQGLNRLSDFANRDLYSFTMNLRKSVDAARSYHNYATPTATSTKFIFKTPSL